jgi:hypothetical protein
MAAKKRRKRAATADTAQIPNQIFLGLPWRTVRPKYEAIVNRLRKTFPLTFIIVGREENQDAEDLLEVIKKRILTSSYAIFDATGGNANVSLEFGFAEASNVPRAIYLSTHQAARRATRESPIIADLVGKPRTGMRRRTVSSAYSDSSVRTTLTRNGSRASLAQASSEGRRAKRSGFGLSQSSSWVSYGTRGRRDVRTSSRTCRRMPHDTLAMR